ncbi:fas-binding factor 1 isoform X2 [Anthonomus grandis grandis]|uniref:fas-binding factor 1 isoform X2 n=1 Tax=Anthonomus grandis grandis TaxID=2921223 RepID=UPI0021652743|nr:fas-binding factor 1 isoform X2 [Anthonomus grandis grandis]
MDLDLDDNFESDDSFFDDPKITKKPAKSAEKKSIEDIFGFEDEKKNDEKIGAAVSNENITNIPAAKPKVRFDIEDSTTPKVNEPPLKSKTPDWLLGDDTDLLKPKKPPSTKSELFDDPPANPKKPFDLLDDILPQRSNKKPEEPKTSLGDILKESKAKSGPSSLEKPKKDEQQGGFSTILEPPQGTRRGRRGSSTGMTDVLGLFGSGPSSSEYLGASKPASVEKKREGTRAKDFPDWLGGSTTEKSDTSISIPKTDYSNQTVEVKDAVDSAQNVVAETNHSEAPEIPVAPSFETNLSNLQTQESILLVSFQLKKYEENLMEIKNQQQEILKKQENQFDTFLNKYIEKQKVIEHEMLNQQERINEHIRHLALKGFEHHKSPIRGQEEDALEETSMAVPYEKTIQSLKQRHEEEFFLMEESYKKQISLLEKSLEQVEQRLSQEMENIQKVSEEKVKNSQRQHQEDLQTWILKVQQLSQKHQEELQELKENHSKQAREIKMEFLEQIERIKEQREREQDLFKEGAEISRKLNDGVERLERNEEILDKLQEKAVRDYDVLSIARERSIENKEREIAAMRQTLDKCREQTEKDRSQLLALIRTLEHKISEQNLDCQEERWALQQAAATLAARSAAFDREVEFSRSGLEREREQLKTLKETLLAEQERITMQLTEEKLKLVAEKSKLDVSAKLVNSYEIEKIKTEAETAINVAKELTEKLNMERNSVLRQKSELESLRQQLLEKERNLIEREEYLELNRQSMQQKSLEDKRLVQETKFLENRYKEKLQELQSQAMSLSNREKKLAEEKLLVSKERLNLYTSMKSQTGANKCMLCRTEEHTTTKQELIGH